MKKIIIFVASFLVLIIAIVGIVALSDESPPSAGTAAPATTTPTQSPAITPAEQDYLNTIVTQATATGNALSQLGTLFENYQFGDDEWTIQVAVQLAIIRVGYEEAIALSPPSSLVAIHNTYTQALSHYNAATYLIADGVDALDASLLDQALAELETGNQLIDQVTAMMDDFETSHGVPPATTQPEPVTFDPIIVTGSGDKTSAPFLVTTSEWIIDWSYTTDDPEYAIFGFFVYPRGETAAYVEMAMAGEGQTSGTTYSYAGPGEYYIKALAGNISSWQITIRPA